MIKRICEYLRGNKNKELESKIGTIIKNKELVSKIDRIIVYVCDLRKWSDEHQRDTILAIDSLKRWFLDHQDPVIEMLNNIHGRLSALEKSGQQTTSSDEHQRDTILAIDSLKRWSKDHQATVIEMLSNIHCFMKEINGRLSALEKSGLLTTSMADRLQPCSNCKNTERKKKHLSKRARSKKQEGDRSPIKVMVGGANEA